MMDSWTLPLIVLAIWLTTGGVVGYKLDRAGQPTTTAISAFVAWPILLSLLSDPHITTGPYATAIREAFQRLAQTLADPIAGDVPWAGELQSLRDSLISADSRMAMVDRLLVDEDPDTESGDELRAARDHAAQEIEAVLAGLVDLRLQIGLYALEGGEQSVQAELRALQARASALSEVRATQWSG